jgi:multiple sugar transport system substrate-binding protein
MLWQLSKTRRLRAGRAVAVLASTILLAACSGGDGNGAPSAQPGKTLGPAKLTVWSFGDADPKVIAAWKQAYPNIELDIQKQPSNGYYPKLQAAIKAGNAPDVVNVEYMYLPTIAASGGLVDLNQYGAQNVKDKFQPAAWNQVALAGKVFSIPIDLAPMVMYYRQDVFKKYGIEVPTTWDEYAQAAEKLHKADPKKYISTFSPGDTQWFSSLVWQAGGRWFQAENDQWKVGINDEGSKKVAQFWQGLVDKKLVSTQPLWTDAWNRALNDGTLATWVAPSWGHYTIEGAAAKSPGAWRVAQMPAWEKGQQASSLLGGSSWAVTTASKHPAEAAELAKWNGASDFMIEQYLARNNIPAANVDPAKRPEVKPTAFWGNQSIDEEYWKALPAVREGWSWGPEMTYTFTALQDGFSKALTSSGSLTGVLDQAQRATVDNLKQQNINVAG